MANVNVKFNGKEFLLSCEDGQEEHLQELTENLNEKFQNLKSSLGSIGENKLLLITSITVMDEYYETKKKIEKNKDELLKITEKFKWKPTSKLNLEIKNYVNWFKMEGRSYKVIPQVAREFRANEAMLDQYYVRTGSGAMVPLSSIASFSKSVEPSERLQFQQLKNHLHVIC